MLSLSNKMSPVILGHVVDNLVEDGRYFMNAPIEHAK